MAMCRINIILMGMSVLLISACQSTQQQDPSDLIGQTDLWAVSLINGQVLQQPTPATFQINERSGQISGTTGCNRISADFQRDGDSISVSTISQTKKMCAEPLNQRERTLIAILSTASSIRADDTNLIISGDDGVIELTPSREGSQ